MKCYNGPLMIDRVPWQWSTDYPGCTGEVPAVYEGAGDSVWLLQQCDITLRNTTPKTRHQQNEWPWHSSSQPWPSSTGSFIKVLWGYNMMVIFIIVQYMIMLKEFACPWPIHFGSPVSNFFWNFDMGRIWIKGY